jgi:hypothetical protein
MVRRAARWMSLAAAIAASALLVACKQGEGDRCEVDNDCTAGLTCENPAGTSGHCTSRPGSSIPSVDAGPEAGRLDAAQDAARDVPADLAPDTADSRPPDTAGDGSGDGIPSDANGDGHEAG